MQISGFSFCRNADKLYYPVVESILSALPLCSEFIVAVGKGDANDRTRELIAGIGDPRIRIIDTEWIDRDRLRGQIHSQQTNIALRECSGDWCLYLQSDEVLHERDLPLIRTHCENLLDDRRTEGMALRYLHFWGDYNHVHRNHAWYPSEVRIVRNGIGVESFRTAQSFRLNGNRLRAVQLEAEVYHYGWVRPPEIMRSKSLEFATTHHGREKALQMNQAVGFNYGSLERIPCFTGTHPSVMRDRMSRLDWSDRLLQTGPSPVRFKHDRLKYRFLSAIEQKLARGRIRLGKAPFKKVRTPCFSPEKHQPT